jgi:hypothetical protein
VWLKLLIRPIGVALSLVTLCLKNRNIQNCFIKPKPNTRSIVTACFLNHECMIEVEYCTLLSWTERAFRMHSQDADLSY